VVTNPRTGQRYLLPRKINIATYTINDLHKISGRSAAASADRRGFYTIGDVWKMIIKCAHQTGEPGLIFIDRINRDNPTPNLGPIEATNPCGEQPLLPYEACTLGSVNLTKFVKYVDAKPQVDWAGLVNTITLAVRFLDNIIDVCNYPVRNTVRLAQANRKIGLGLMGFADCLFMLGIPYDSEKALDFAQTIMSFFNTAAHNASIALANVRGPFPNWNESIWRTKRNTKIRNAAVTSIAPTGTISILADCSNGIEPVYSLVFLRRILGGVKLLQVDPFFKQIAQKEGFFSKKLADRIAKTGSIQKIPQIPARLRKIFKCAYDISPQWHVRMQAAFQENCDAAVSKTINFSEEATLAAVEKAYKLAYPLGCKGITVYRRSSRREEPMSLY
jgi:ribonucleoside-diphosphate reductase alpha chain